MSVYLKKIYIFTNLKIQGLNNIKYLMEKYLTNYQPYYTEHLI